MRYLILLLLVQLSLTTLSAQIQKGDKLFDFTQGGDLASLTVQNEIFSVGIAPRMAWAVTDRIMVGATAVLNVINDESVSGTATNFALVPQLRYYFINKARGQTFALVGTVLSEERELIDRDLEVAIGHSIPLAANIRLTPRATYSFGTRNALGVTAGLEVVLGKNSKPDEVDVTFARGQVMAGVSTAQLLFSEDVTSLFTNLNGHVFVTPNLAVGARFGVSLLRTDLTTGVGRNAFNAYSTDFIVNGRYYLGSTSRLRFYGQVGGGLSFLGFDFGDDTDSLNDTNPVLDFRVGGQYFLRDNLALDFGPSYLVQFGSNGFESGLVLDSSNRFSINLGVSFLLGRR